MRGDRAEPHGGIADAPSEVDGQSQVLNGLPFAPQLVESTGACLQRSDFIFGAMPALAVENGTGGARKRVLELSND